MLLRYRRITSFSSLIKKNKSVSIVFGKRELILTSREKALKLSGPKSINIVMH